MWRALRVQPDRVRPFHVRIGIDAIQRVHIKHRSIRSLRLICGLAFGAAAAMTVYNHPSDTYSGLVMQIKRLRLIGEAS